MDRMVRRAVRGIMVAAACGATLWPGGARAAEPPPALWRLGAAPAQCSRFIPSLAREVELACDASGGGCRLAAPEDAAGLEAVLSCGESDATPWTLAAVAPGGAELSTVTLDGGSEERLRKAALWIARTRVPEPADRPGSPTPSPRDDAANAAGSEAPPPERQAIVSESGGLTLDALYGAGSDGTHRKGIRGAALFEGKRSVHTGFSLAAASESLDTQPRSSLDSARSRRGWSGRAGVVATIGGPGTDDVLGLAVETGLAFGGRNGSNTNALCVGSFAAGEACTSNPAVSSTSETYASPYFSASLLLQLPSHLPVNLFTAMSVTWEPLYYRDSQLFFGFSLGVSWRAW